MKVSTFAIITLIILTGIFSCGKKVEQNAKAEKETPIALQDNKILKSYSTVRNDLPEELYMELVENSPELTKLEDDIENTRTKKKEVSDIFHIYNNKTDGYYYSSANHANSITDSLLKKRILALISTSKENYSRKTAEITSLLEKISKNESTLADNHLALKIVLTLPIIEKFQNDNHPNKNEFQELITEQERLIKNTGKLTIKR